MVLGKVGQRFEKVQRGESMDRLCCITTTRNRVDRSADVCLTEQKMKVEDKNDGKIIIKVHSKRLCLCRLKLDCIYRQKELNA